MRGEAVRGHALLVPYFALFCAFVLVPAAASIVLSFSDWRIVGEPRFVGGANYAWVLSDPVFRRALVNTLLFTAMTVPLLAGGGIALALLLHRSAPGRGLARLSVFAPTVVMVPVVGILWRWIYDTNFGFANAALSAAGGPRIPWLTHTGFALPAIAVTTLWWTVGTNALIYLAGLKTIPASLYEAAALEGAGAWRVFRSITLPLLWAVHAFVLPMTMIASLRVFGQVYVMTQGGPYGGTYTLVQHLYKTGFSDFRMGEACAVAVLLFALTLAGTLLQLRALRAL